VAGRACVPAAVIPGLEDAARQRVADLYAFMAELTAFAAKK
jgi:hypothetical protein